MFWTILARIFRRHMTYHLLIPLVVGICVDLLIVVLTHPLDDMRDYFLSVEKLGLAGGIFAAYFIIMYFVVKEETTARIDAAGHAILSGCLKGAVGYFAVNTISVREWFGPAAQEYLSVIARHHKDNPGFRHERVLLFMRERDFEDLVTPYLDYNYAHALVQIHRNYDIPLSFIRRVDLHKVLGSLTVMQRKAIGCYRWGLAWCPEKVLGFPLWHLRRRIPGLGFAFIEMPQGKSVVLRITKHGDNMIIHKLTGHAADPYTKIVRLIKETVHVHGTTALKPEYDFADQILL